MLTQRRSIVVRKSYLKYIIFFCDFDFYRFRLSIDINRRIKSMNQTDFRYRFLSINYVCNSNFQAFRQSERGRKIYEEKTTFSPRTLPTDSTDCRALSSERLERANFLEASPSLSYETPPPGGGGLLCAFVTDAQGEFLIF